MIEINWHPSRKELNIFAALWLVFFSIVAFVVYRRFGSAQIALTIVCVAAAVIVVGLAIPRWLRIVYLTWTLIGFPIGWLVSHAVLAAVYYGVVTPVGLLMRMFGRDPMCRRWDRERKSYWEPRPPRDDVQSYFKQF